MSIEVSNLTKIYGQQKAINNISFTIDKSESYFLKVVAVSDLIL